MTVSFGVIVVGMGVSAFCEKVILLGVIRRDFVFVSFLKMLDVTKLDVPSVSYMYTFSVNSIACNKIIKRIHEYHFFSYSSIAT